MIASVITGNMHTCGWEAELRGNRITITTVHGRDTTIPYSTLDQAARTFGLLIRQYAQFGLSQIEHHLEEEATA